MQKTHYDFKYNKESNTFSLAVDNKERMIFDDFELNFRMTRLPMKLGRVHPEKAILTEDTVSYPLRLWGMGSTKTMYLAEPSGRVYTTAINDTLLISYANDINENSFSPEQAIRMSISNLPGIEKCLFFHNRSNEFQSFDCEGLWWSQSVFVNDVTSDLSHDWGLLSCWKYSDGVIGGILPVTTDKLFGRLRGTPTEGLSVISCTGRSNEVIKNYPLAIIAFSDSVDDLVNQLFSTAHELYPNFNFRNKDTLPTPFDNLGWCTWNAFGNKVQEDDIKSSIDKFKQDNIPIRYIILDDGWSDIKKVENNLSLQEGMTTSYLKSCEPDKDKFPAGLENLIEYAKKNGIESFGVWHALNGYWQGLLPDAQIVKKHPDWFITANNDIVIPAPGGGFYEFWHKRLKKCGVNFLKIDNQGFHRQCLPYSHNMPEYMAGIQTDLNNSVEKHKFPIMYCMATHPETFFNCSANQLLRVSNDFKPDDSFGSRKHVVNNFYNSSWLSKIFWPDFDMFQTNDIFAETFARMLAISGSPIYTTDRPEKINQNMLRRLALPNGQIPRYDDLARILPSRFFDNPYSAGNILAVSAKKHNITTLGLFNTIETGHSFSGKISLQELGLDQDCLIYSNANQFAPRIINTEDSIHFSLENMESDLIYVSPIDNNFALIGVVDYFAAPAIIENVERNKNNITINLKGKGLLVGYLQSKPSSVTCHTTLSEVDTTPQPGEYSYKNKILKIYAESNFVKITIT